MCLHANFEIKPIEHVKICLTHKCHMLSPIISLSYRNIWKYLMCIVKCLFILKRNWDHFIVSLKLAGSKWKTTANRRTGTNLEVTKVMRPGETNECPSLVIIRINVSMNCSCVYICWGILFVFRRYWYWMYNAVQCSITIRCVTVYDSVVTIRTIGSNFDRFCT